MTDPVNTLTTLDPLELERQASANILCLDRLEIEKIESPKLKMPLMLDWQVQLRSHVKQFRELYGSFGAAREFITAMSTPPDSWMVTYQHGYTNPSALEASVVVAGPAILNMLGDVAPFTLAEWLKHCHPDDLDPVVEAQMHSNDAHEPFDQIFRTKTDGSWKWVRGTSRSVGVDEKGNHRYSGVLMDYTGFLPEDMQVVAIELGDESSGDSADLGQADV